MSCYSVNKEPRRKQRGISEGRLKLTTKAAAGRGELGRVFKIGHGRVASQFCAVARREEGEYPLRSLTDEQQRCSPKAPPPFGPGLFCLPASSLARHVASAMLLARLLARRQKPSRRGHVLFCKHALKAKWAVALIAFAPCLAGCAKAMTFEDFAKMNNDDEAGYVVFLVEFCGFIHFAIAKEGI